MAPESRTPDPDADGVSRRSVIRTAAVAGAAAVAGIGLAACGGGDDSGNGYGTAGNANPAPNTDTPNTDTPNTDTPAGGGGGPALAKTSEIPVGGGKVIDRKIVVTQPTEGKFVAFSAICTHQGCPVNRVRNGTISCPCHGSKFSAEDGSVTGGPAPRPLAPVNIKVDGDSIVQA